MKNSTSGVCARMLGSLVLSFLIAGSVSAARADVIQWTINNGVLININGFGSVTVSGYFDEGAPISDITVVENGLYTYTFTGPLNGSDYGNRQSQQPPTLCILAGCSPFGAPVPGTPMPVSLSIGTCNLITPPGPYPLACGTGFEDNLQPFGFPTGTVTGTIIPTPPSVPEPATWTLGALGLAAIALHRRRWQQS
jgi:MYXO-CTERM domain-containing protein